jgi:hypothetical protein
MIEPPPRLSISGITTTGCPGGDVARRPGVAPMQAGADAGGDPPVAAESALGYWPDRRPSGAQTPSWPGSAAAEWRSNNAPINNGTQD